MAQNGIYRRVEEIILLLLIIMNVSEFFGVLPSDGSFIKMVITLTGIGYVLFKVSLSDLFVGQRYKHLDLLLLSSYFLLIVNKFVEYSEASYGSAHILRELFVLIVENALIIETFAMYVGSVFLILISIHIAFNIPIIGPSILHAVHAEKAEVNKFYRLIGVFVVVVGFYLIFFNMIIEWMSLVIDSSLIILAIFLYLFKIHNLGKSMSKDMILFKIASSTETAVEEFIKLFHSRKTIFLGISAILVLHLLTDIGAFIIPYVLGTHSLYVTELGHGHANIPSLFLEDVNTLGLNYAPFVLFSYLMNIVSILMLMLFPAFIWYVIYINKTKERQEGLVFPRYLITLFFGSLCYFIFHPAFEISSISTNLSTMRAIIGVDIATRSVLQSAYSVSFMFFLSAIVILSVYVLTKIPRMKEYLFVLMTVICLLFFGLYIFYFFNSILRFYYEIIQLIVGNSSVALAFSTQNWMLLLQNFGDYLIVFYYVLFMLIFIVFYLGGFITFILAVFRE